MLTSIIEPGQYMVGTKIFKTGDVVPLVEEEQKEMDAICEIFESWNKARTALLNEVHLTEEPFSIELAKKAHEMKIENFKLRFRLNLLIAAVEKRFGGLLPIFFSSTTKNLIISGKPEESLVYTVKFISDTIGMPAFDFPRAVASALVGKENVYFDNEKDEVLSCVSAFGNAPDKEMWAQLSRLEALAGAIESTLVEEGPTAMSLLVLWGEDEVRILNADAIPSTVDPNTRVFWNLDKILPEVKPKAVSVVVEKAEPSKVSFFVSHLAKDQDPRGAEIIHTIAPARATETNLETKANFAITRMMPDAINDLLV